MAAEPDAVPHRSSPTPSVLLVSTDWRDWDVTSAMVTVNSIVAQCLISTCSDILVYSTVVQFQDSISSEVRAAAERAHVQLIGCEKPRREAVPKKDWLTECWEQHYPCLAESHNFTHVIGYFPQTAKTAIAIRDGLRGKGLDCTCVLLVVNSRRKKPLEKSIKLINKADVVYSVGPLLFRECDRHVTVPHRMIFPVPHVIDVTQPSVLLSDIPGTMPNKDIVTFYPENGIRGPGEEHQHKMLVLVIKAISEVAKSYFLRHNANVVEWHIYGVPDKDREEQKAVIQEHSVFLEFKWMLHQQPADATKILELASLCVSPWQTSYDPNALYPLVYGVPTLLCAGSGVAEILFSDFSKDDESSTLLTAMAVVNSSSDTEGDGWTARIQGIIYSPINMCGSRQTVAGADFQELGRRIRVSAALQESMKTFNTAMCAGQVSPGPLTSVVVESAGAMATFTAVSIEQRPAPSTMMSATTTLQHVQHAQAMQAGHCGRPLLGRKMPLVASTGDLPRERPGPPMGPGRNGPTVKPWTDVERYEQLVDSEGVYKMTASPRGFALIININKVTGGEERMGSEVDEHNLCNLFSQLDFKCITKKDLTRQEILDELKDLSKSEELRHHDCLVVCLMSHGKEGVIFASDKKHVAVTEVCEIFSRCKPLYGKPKLIFIQACRGEHTDEGETRADGPTDNVAVIKPPTMSDMLVVYPSSLGYKSYRNTVHGSWLISKLVPVFLEHACHEHIAELLTRVNREVSQMETLGRDVPPGNVAQPEAHWALCKLLYFFPGK